jgi:anti-anti-sigma regulatory factor
MFKISIVEDGRQRVLILEGRLASPWTTEVENAWKTAGEHLQGRKLVVDLRNVTFISADGESTLLKLMKDGARFSCNGVLTKHVLKQLARLCRCTP